MLSARGRESVNCTVSAHPPPDVVRPQLPSRPLTIEADSGKTSSVATLRDVPTIARGDSWLAIVSTVRADSTIQSSLVNAAVMKHPLTGTEVIAFVTYGRAKLANLRARPQINVAFKAGWQWIAVEGTAEIIGPDDPHADVDQERLRLLLREIFSAAGGTHDDWDEYDRVMARDRRAAVFVNPTRVYSNAGQ
jgi:PPOX class probable F420-dependent enzyme